MSLPTPTPTLPPKEEEEEEEGWIERKKERKNQKTIKRSHAIIVTVFPFDVLTELGHL